MHHYNGGHKIKTTGVNKNTADFPPKMTITSHKAKGQIQSAYHNDLMITEDN